MSEIACLEIVGTKIQIQKQIPRTSSRARALRADSKNARDCARDDRHRWVARQVLMAMTRRAPEGWCLILMLAAVLSCALSSAGQAGRGPGGASGEEFFIISSVDTAKKQLLLKEPTEITQILQVNEKTRYMDKGGKAMPFADLRAGDTVYIKSVAAPGGRMAVSIRKGPMTVEELHRRYLK
jgi:hypothetical protein